jgi:hypothetical protein
VSVCVCVSVRVSVCVSVCVCECVSAAELALVCNHDAVMFREICSFRLIKTNFRIITIVNSEVPVYVLHFPSTFSYRRGLN